MKSKPAKSKPVDDPNISAIARQYGLARNTLMRWRDQGLDLSDAAAVEAKVKQSKAGPAPDSAALLAHCRTHLAGYKCPRSIDIVEDIGRNPMGKVNKRQLRAPFWPSDRTIGG